MNKLSRLVKRAEFKHLLLLVGVGAVGVGTWRAFFDHNSTPVLIVGAALAFAALISDRLTSAEVAVGKAVPGAHYAAVARVLAFVYRLRTGRAA